MSKAATNGEGVTLSEPRMMACLEAAWELDALARVLPGLVPRDDQGMHLAVRGVAGRLLRLAHVLMSGLGDDAEPTEKLERIISFDGGQG